SLRSGASPTQTSAGGFGLRAAVTGGRGVRRNHSSAPRSPFGMRSAGTSLARAAGGTEPPRTSPLLRDLRPVAAPQRVERAVAVRTPVGVRAEVVALPLGERGRQALRAQRVVVGEGRRETGGRHALPGRRDQDLAPVVLRVGDLPRERLVG